MGGVVVTVAGSNFGYYDGVATSALFAFPAGITFDSGGGLVVADTWNNCVRRVIGGNVSTIAGVSAGWSGYAADGYPATSTSFDSPAAVAVSGTFVVVSEPESQRIRL